MNKISARNCLKGKVIEITKGQVAAKVKIDIGVGNVLTSMVLVDSIGDLNLKEGDEVYAVIKSTEVMVAK